MENYDYLNDPEYSSNPEDYFDALVKELNKYY
jgi:hypothetical protein